MPGLTPRHWIALTALVSGTVATYLHLWKLGLAGTLACGGGHGCELVQFSSWSWFLGYDVAFIGAVGYSLIFVTALIGTMPRWQDDRRNTLLLACLVYPAILFTLRLKYAEFIILKTFCPWCAVSAVTITLHGILVALDWRRVSRRAAPAS
ncbi:MAG TPA: vitamin K epoxide reductase family protein [Gemmatimonadales bacterium]|nr:vitamin K epoxide reductase family protein [Gemmatimonadales bacterium]